MNEPIDTIEPSPELVEASEPEPVAQMNNPDKRNTPQFLFQRLFGPSQAGAFECVVIMARRAGDKGMMVAMSDDVQPAHLCIYAQMTDQFAKLALGLVPLPPHTQQG